MDEKETYIRPNEKNFINSEGWKKIEKQMVIAVVSIAVLIVTEIIKTNLEEEFEDDIDLKKW